MTYGIRVAKSGFDTSELKNLVYSSEFNTQKDSLNGLEQYTVSSPEVKTIVNHNLGYIPAFKVYYDNNDGIFHDTAAETQGGYVGPSYENAIAYADSNNLYISLGATGSVTYRVRYFIFKNLIQ